ncbi:hypothetical protein [Krasilnikovia sp. MM14-A1004]|uniref:hypothetical protein n=1 Tax=Krasilnikovia sp. MM14-A1004 TaxID=3373541 RepID=UPI00399C8B56
MASAPASERRPRTLRRVVRRLFTDRWTGRRRAPGPGPAVGADLATTLPVRASWSLLRWWRRWRPRHDNPPPASAGRAIGAAPAMLRDSPARSRAVTGRGLPGTLGALRPPLASGPAAGPDVRPGHEPALRPALGPVPRDHRGGHGWRRTGGAGILRLVRPGDGHPHPWADVAADAPYREGPLGVRPVLPRAGAAGRSSVAPAGPTVSGPGGGAPRTGGLPTPGGGDAVTGAFGPGVGRSAGSSGGAVPGTGPGLVTGPELRTGRRPFGRPGSLTSRPGSGPSVRNPESAADLTVLGAGPLPPGTGPDPAGAVTTSLRPDPGRGLLGGYGMPVPEKPGSERPGSERPGPMTKPGSDKPDPRARWEAAVAARPLEAPRPLPGALHAMAAALTGRAHPPMFTTGPATRHALAAAGALGATTGIVVHLPRAPANVPVMSEVLAHELTHTRNPVRRPRFLLERAAGLLDDDERQALSAGRQAGEGLLSAGRQAGEGLLSAGRQRLADAAPSAAGIVDQLPVGGGPGAVGDVATRAARAAVLEATSGPMAGLTGAVSEARDTAAGALASAGGLAADAASGVTGAVDAAAGAVSGAATGAASAVAGAAGGAVGAAKAALDPDKVVEIVEARLLREIERRGGRWAGVF